LARRDGMVWASIGQIPYSDTGQCIGQVPIVHAELSLPNDASFLERLPGVSIAAQGVKYLPSCAQLGRPVPVARSESVLQNRNGPIDMCEPFLVSSQLSERDRKIPLGDS